MKNVDLNLFGQYGIRNIFIHENMFKYLTKAINWIKNALTKKFKIHI